MTSMSGSTGANYQGKQLRGADPRLKAPHGYRQTQNFTNEALGQYNQLFSQIGEGSDLSRLAMGDEEMFNQIEAPALRQQSGAVGNLASRFSQPGLGARKSSGFQNSARNQASDFALQLQGQRQGLQRQAMQDIMGYSQMLFNQDPYGLQKKPEKQGGGWGGLIGGGIGAVGGGILGGPAGALQGAQMGYNVGNAFSGGASGGGQSYSGGNLPNNWGNFAVNYLPGGV
jgi:hypothetical protein